MPGKPYLSFINKTDEWIRSGQTRRKGALNERFVFYCEYMRDLLPFVGKSGAFAKKLGMTDTKFSNLVYKLKNKDKIIKTVKITLGKSQYNVFLMSSQDEKMAFDAVKAFFEKKGWFCDNSKFTLNHHKAKKQKRAELVHELFNDTDSASANITALSRKSNKTRYLVDTAVKWALQEEILLLEAKESGKLFLVKNHGNPFWYNVPVVPAVEAPEIKPEEKTDVSQRSSVPENQVNRQSDVSTWPQIKPASA